MRGGGAPGGGEAPAGGRGAPLEPFALGAIDCGAPHEVMGPGVGGDEGEGLV